MKRFIIILLITFPVLLNAQNSTVVTFNNVHQRFGNGNDTRTVTDTFLLPNSIVGYKQIIMHYALSCPTGGCDPWDRYGMVSLKKGNEWLELGRYMTPYKKACGADYDVTEYSSLLTGKIVLSSFIDTWVDPGWLVKVSFEYVKGTPQIPATKVENIWQSYNQVYGDPAKPINFSSSPTVESKIKSAKLKIVLTGHGQGNTDNAAEFSQNTHKVYVNNASVYSHYLWRDDCASNSCSNQSGTWKYSRAGWCPGASVLPVYVDLTSQLNTGKVNKLEYRLQTYENSCRPTNTNCKSGVTCADCDYNYNGHTEPYYAMSAQLITYLDQTTGIGSVVSNQLEFSLFPNPASQQIELQLPTNCTYPLVISFFNTTGQKIKPDQIIQNQYEQKVDISNLQKGIYFLQIKNRESEGSARFVILPE